jgi:hypothetical protein
MMNIGLKMGETVIISLFSPLYLMGAVICGDKQETLHKMGFR